MLIDENDPQRELKGELESCKRLLCAVENECSRLRAMNTEFSIKAGESLDIIHNLRCDVLSLDATVSRLKRELADRASQRSDAGSPKTGCARDQRTTQFCAEALDAQRHVETLKAELVRNADEFAKTLTELRQRVGTLTAERDEIRLSYCLLMEAYRGGDGRVTANKLGWGYLFAEDSK